MIVHPAFMFDCNLAPHGKKALMKWGWLKKVGGWIIRYAPGLVDTYRHLCKFCFLLV